jgi:uncharacterized tellurite resistance protein B-like protein
MNMEQTRFNYLLLKTAFSCMACDGEIDKQEISLLKELHRKKKLFGEIDLIKTLDELFLEINKDSYKFIRNYFDELLASKLSQQDELKIIEIAIDTIKADDKIEYSEIKFFKVIRSKLTINNDSILTIHPDYEEFLEQDIISTSYLLKFQNDYLDVEKIPLFENINFELKGIDTEEDK